MYLTANNNKGVEQMSIPIKCRCVNGPCQDALIQNITDEVLPYDCITVTDQHGKHHSYYVSDRTTAGGEFLTFYIKGGE
jgi:hypothetical protein